MPLGRFGPGRGRGRGPGIVGRGVAGVAVRGAVRSRSPVRPLSPHRVVGRGPLGPGRGGRGGRGRH